MWGDYDDDPYHDQDYAFDITCTSCGCVYDSMHNGPCPSCGSSSQTYSSGDASRWNEHLRRTGR